jgi:hypothetical protein
LAQQAPYNAMRNKTDPVLLMWDLFKIQKQYLFFGCHISVPERRKADPAKMHLLEKPRRLARVLLLRKSHTDICQWTMRYY